ncbi:recombinase family protein [Nocardia farcinica]|uniref:recombinase family protein n=1 Tax=Nocardia farcinica TaxID=37329 RepID=UPI001E354D74|nr:recombinase family protein [Nocardia farcinica]
MGEPFRIGYCRCSTDEQDVEIQTEQLLALGAPRERIFIDKGFSGTTRKNRAGLDNALAAATSAAAAIDERQVVLMLAGSSVCAPAFAERNLAALGVSDKRWIRPGIG